MKWGGLKIKNWAFGGEKWRLHLVSFTLSVSVSVLVCSNRTVGHHIGRGIKCMITVIIAYGILFYWYVKARGFPDVQSQPCLKVPLSWPGILDGTFPKSLNSSHVSNWQRAQRKHLEVCNALHCLNCLLTKPTSCPLRKRFFPQKMKVTELLFFNCAETSLLDVKRGNCFHNQYWLLAHTMSNLA